MGFLGFLFWHEVLAASHLSTPPGAPQALPTLLAQKNHPSSKVPTDYFWERCIQGLTLLMTELLWSHSLGFSIPGSTKGLQAGRSSWKGMQGSALVRLKLRLPVHEPYTNRERRRRAGIYVLPKKLYIDFLQFCAYKMSARKKKSGAWQDEGSHVYCSCSYGNLQMPPVFPFHTQMRGQLWGPHVCQGNNICELGWLGQKITTHLY